MAHPTPPPMDDGPCSSEVVITLPVPPAVDGAGGGESGWGWMAPEVLLTLLAGTPPPPSPIPRRALQMELVELRTERARAVESRTVMGHLKNAMGYGMSLYCVYRYHMGW